jgi:hypothetical protein
MSKSQLLLLSGLLAAVASSAPYYVLNVSDFEPLLAEDTTWAANNIPLFESSDKVLTSTYYFRWRTYKRHINNVTGRTDGVNYVVTEFSPKVSWAGKYNTINCAAGHHILEGRWLRDQDIMDSYVKWWVASDSRHNYYYWYAHSLLERVKLSGDLSVVVEVLPSYIGQFEKYAKGELPAENAAFSTESDCLWNAPGNEGQENSLSGAGCRPLIQSMMFGEANAIKELCAIIKNSSCVERFSAEAERWRGILLRQWNPNITVGHLHVHSPCSFTMRITHHLSLITHHSSPITHHPSLITHHPSPITHHPSLV